MGLYKRKGSQYYWMSLLVNGKRVYESTKTTNKKLAEKVYSKMLTEIIEGKWFQGREDEKATMGEVLDRYMTEVSPSLALTTQARNEQMVKNLKNFFRDHLLTKTTASVVSSYKARRLKKGSSRETVRRELGFLRRVFNIAIHEWELCSENPVTRVLRTLGKIDNNRVRYLSPEESQRLMEALPGWLKPIVTIARHTGLRRGNLINLSWQEVDLRRRVIVVSSTKNGEPIGIPLTEKASRTLAKLQKVRYLRSEYVFCDGEGHPYSPSQVTTAFRRACKRSGVDNFRFHDLRHDFASKLVQAGVDIFKVKELLGHKDLRMTIRYCHLAPENLRDAVSVLDEGEKVLHFGDSWDKKRGYVSVTP